MIFPEGAGGDQIVEKILHGPIHQQIRDALRYIQNNVIIEKVLKHSHRPEATRFFNYPMTAIEEALVNAMYHRGYDQREPVEVRVNPESIQIVSYPGPDPSIRPIDLQKLEFVSRRYRNRRIGEFFKELDMTEGRGTGVPKIRAAMKRNGSPRPKFETDENRLWFVAKLPIHKAFAGDRASSRPKSGPSQAQVEAQELNETERRILDALQDGPLATQAIAAALGHAGLSGAAKLALSRLESARLIELTIPDKPRSRKQMRRLTSAGKAALAAAKDQS